ncbi:MULTISPECIES: nitrite/sulfite reductase [Cetobacterium]|jgi:sulfite reductase beta subunit-like hemoprotein|uniref:Nitrite/sulfite reductase n=1 Tax=Candidatus Cetobacterium colombiensis TaxID=3073100 RepID=A0ABU4W698_9FUSO|nr:nitrite/sulfite reductase [Candidatus Cetobacterium colombiensis]MDX8335055.1 nitrite/sulfite reductase [Candidatus Cetobacterium colombiensis]
MERIEEKLKDIEKEYLELQEGIVEYSNNNLKSADLKKRGSKFGIYEQKGKKMMLRLKAVGGELSTKKFKALADIMKKEEIPYLHLSTRQNYQLHEVDFEKVKATIELCNSNEMYFRGGGGNTFRSILVSTYTGVDKRNIFDVMPYARMVENEVFYMDKAFDFGRKLKIGFSNSLDDEFVMAVQDMGFVAKELNGKRGFKVYCGGGMGRGSKIGYVLIDFLPEEDLLRAVKSLIDLFYDRGDRVNRMQARLRFLVEKMGIDGFKKLYLDYFNKETIKNGKISQINYENKVKELKHYEIEENSEIFNLWKDICVKETKFKDVVSVVLYVKNGDLTAEHIEKLYDLMREINAPTIRATINQNLVLPVVHRSALPYIYKYLNEKIPEIVTETISIKGQIRACVGAKVCMIGVQDSPTVAEAIGKELDNLAKEYPQYRKIIFKEAKNIRISGCPSSCAGVPVAPLGFIGLKKKINDKLVDCMQVYMGGILTESVQSLAFEIPNLILPIDEIPILVKSLFKDYLEVLQVYDVTFSNYMYERRLEEF